MIAFGVAQEKTNTGKMTYQGISRHAKAGWDMFAPHAELLAWEVNVADGFQLLNNIKHSNSAGETAQYCFLVDTKQEWDVYVVAFSTSLSSYLCGRRENNFP